MRLKKGWMRLASTGLVTAALAVPGIPPAPRTAAAAQAPVSAEQSNAQGPASGAEDCDFLLRFGRPWWDDADTPMLPVQLRLTCDGPLAELRFTVDGRPIPADVRVRGGDALLTTFVPLPDGQPGGNLCLTATLMGSSDEEVTHCLTLPAAPRPAERSAGAKQPQARSRPVAPAAVPSSPDVHSSAAGRAPDPDASASGSEGRAGQPPAPGGSGMRVLESGGRPLDAAEASAPGRPAVKRSGPDKSLKLPDGHSWALNDQPRITDWVDNAIARALRSAAAKEMSGAPQPASRSVPSPDALSGPAPSESYASDLKAALSAAPQLPSLPGIQVLQSAGGAVDPDAPAVTAAPRRISPNAAPPAEQARDAAPAPAAGAGALQGGAAGRARPSYITEPPVVSGEGRAVDPPRNRAVVEKDDGPDFVIRRSIRPAAPPAMPKVLVKAGDAIPARSAAGLGALGLMMTAAGIALRRREKQRLAA